MSATTDRAILSVILPEGYEIADLRFVSRVLNGGNSVVIEFGSTGDALAVRLVGDALENNLNISDSFGGTLAATEIMSILTNAGANIGIVADDVFQNRAANDIFDGGGGADIVEFGLGTGEDLLNAPARIRLKPGVDFEQLKIEAYLTQFGSYLTLSICRHPSVRISGSYYVLDEIEDTDGNVVSVDQLYEAQLLSQFTSGDDIVNIPYMETGQPPSPGTRRRYSCIWER